MKIFNVQQIRSLDQYTIEHEPIASIDLMERASVTFVKWFVKQFPDRKRAVQVYCGPGNNGGDGLAIARLLSQDHYSVKAFTLGIGRSRSTDCQHNLDRLLKKRCCPLVRIEPGDSFYAIDSGTIVIDAIFGSGLSRPVEGYWAEFIRHLNSQQATRVAVDVPSGMFADRPTKGISIKADYSFSFEMPKLGFLFPENVDRVGEWSCESIGLHKTFIGREDTNYHFSDSEAVTPFIKSRTKYSHKGTYGHALLLAGSHGKVGAATLAAKAIMKSGAGLLTVHAPACAYPILQVSTPEAMVLSDKNELLISEIPKDLSNYNAVGIGPGISTNELTAKALWELLVAYDRPVVLDADALNILAANKSWLKKIPRHSILTPHPKEFTRLFGNSENDFERNELQRNKAQSLGIYIILKGAHSAIACPDGNCFFNSTGNPGMATGGSGDVLTGIITGLLAQGYSSFEAAKIGVYLHGLAGDLAATQCGQEAMLASDIIEHIGSAFKSLHTLAK
ncbi:MAG: NAD(P)H-hydrate dehydratase [Bacteroidota bacterium]